MPTEEGLARLGPIETVDLIVAIREAERDGDYDAVHWIDAALKSRIDRESRGSSMAYSNQWEAWAWRNDIPRPGRPNGYYAYQYDGIYEIAPIAYWHLHGQPPGGCHVAVPAFLYNFEDAEDRFRSNRPESETRRAFEAMGFAWLEEPNFSNDVWTNVDEVNYCVRFDGVPRVYLEADSEAELVGLLNTLGHAVKADDGRYTVMSDEVFAAYTKWKPEDRDE